MRILCLALVLLVVVGALDYLTGYEISFGIFYLGPVSMAAWYAGSRWGIVFAIASSVTWYGVELLAGQPYEHPFVPVWNAGVRFTFFLITSLLLSTLRERLDLESRLARTDSLTGLLNSRAFTEQLEHDLAINARGGRTLTLVYIDLDNFKAINDQGGHLEGDRQLSQVASGIRSVIRHSDTAGRLGGDEFAVILPDTDRAGATRVLTKLAQELRSPAGGTGSVTCSIGALTIGKSTPTADDVIGRADRLMYTAKQGGKDRFVVQDYDEN